MLLSNWFTTTDGKTCASCLRCLCPGRTFVPVQGCAVCSVTKLSRRSMQREFDKTTIVKEKSDYRVDPGMLSLTTACGQIGRIIDRAGCCTLDNACAQTLLSGKCCEAAQQGLP